MSKRASKATLWLVSLILCAALFFTGCTPQTKVYCDTDTIKIDVVKSVIIVEDKTAGVTYTID